MKIDRLVVVDLEQLLERLVDEDNRDQHGKALLGEARDVADEGAQVERDHEEQHETEPHSDPETELEIVQTVLAEIAIHKARVN